MNKLIKCELKLYAFWILIIVSFILLSGCSLIPKKKTIELSQAERHELEVAKYKNYYCILAKHIEPLSDDTVLTRNRLKQHNDTRNSICQPNQSELQQNNQE